MSRAELSPGASLGKGLNEIFVVGNIRNASCNVQAPFSSVHDSVIRAFSETGEESPTS